MKKVLFIVAMFMVVICGCTSIAQEKDETLVVLSKDNYEVTPLGEKLSSNVTKIPNDCVSVVPVTSETIPCEKETPITSTKMVVLEGGESCNIIYTENGIISEEPAILVYDGGVCDFPCFDNSCDIIYSNGGIISSVPATMIDGTEVIYSNGGYIPVEAATRK